MDCFHIYQPQHQYQGRYDAFLIRGPPFELQHVICDYFFKMRSKLEDRLQKKKIMFLCAKTKCPEKEIKVSAKVLRKCSAFSLILLWQPKSA